MLEASRANLEMYRSSMEERGLAASTIDRRLSTACGFYRFAHIDGRIRLSTSQVYRLVVERPERLSLKILMALLDILDSSMDELIEPVAPVAVAKKTKAAVADAGIGALRPKRARITDPR